MTTKKWAKGNETQSKTKSDIIYVLNNINVSLLTKFCKNKQAFWLLVSRATRVSQPPWPGSLLSPSNFLHPLLGPVLYREYSQNSIRDPVSENTAETDRWRHPIPTSGIYIHAHTCASHKMHTNTHYTTYTRACTKNFFWKHPYAWKKTMSKVESSDQEWGENICNTKLTRSNIPYS